MKTWKKRLRSVSWSAWFGMLVIAMYVLVAVFADVLAPHGEREIVGSVYEPWGAGFILGTDNLGRDMFSRLIYGARNTVGIAMLTTLLAFSVGSITGIVSATLGGWVDSVLGRTVDVLMAIPQLIFALLLLTIFGASILNMILIIALLDSTRVYRISRAAAINVVAMDYIEAARLRGEKLPYLIFSEVLPNITAPLTAEFGLRFCYVFLLISSLSFLGLGIQPPTADWGSMVRDSANLISFGEMTPLVPAFAIALLTVAVNFVADWLLNRTSAARG